MQLQYTGKTLTVGLDDGIAWMTFIQADNLNALSPAMAGEFLDACRQLTDIDDLKVLVLQGSGRAFMAGGDLHALRQDPEGAVAAIIFPMNEAILLLQALPVIILARRHGAVAGQVSASTCSATMVQLQREVRRRKDGWVR